MAEFCQKCFARYFDANAEDAKPYVFITRLDLCEGCNEIKPCIYGVHHAFSPFLLIDYIKYTNSQKHKIRQKK